PKMIAITLDAWPPALASGIFQNVNPMAHGDEFETSCLLYLREELVRRKLIRDQTREIDQEMLRYVSIARLSRLTHTGKPSAATAEKGRRAVECMVEAAVQSIRATLRKVARLRNG
ncbi:MAG: creatininase family protein, partial [Verrucomicrobia bacterium]|nr:creatininase family protein [Verrucomicrobiota bacterium]